MVGDLGRGEKGLWGEVTEEVGMRIKSFGAAEEGCVQAVRFLRTGTAHYLRSHHLQRGRGDAVSQVKSGKEIAAPVSRRLRVSTRGTALAGFSDEEPAGRLFLVLGMAESFAVTGVG